MTDRIEVIKGDITQAHVDVIVNAASPTLTGQAGMDAAIHGAAGSSLREACQLILQHQGECAPGQAVITGAEKLPFKAIIHAIGPVWQGGNALEAEILAETYYNCMELAAANHYSSIAFPAIATGGRGFPAAKAARIAWDTVYRYLGLRPLPQRAVFICFDEQTFDIYRAIADELKQSAEASVSQPQPTTRG